MIVPKYDAQALILWASSILRNCDLPPQDADEIARLLVRSDLRGYGAHGLVRLKSYLERIKDGSFNPKPNIVLNRKGASWTLDADGALGQVVGSYILNAARPFLQNEPLLWVNVHRTGHLGALGVLALEAAEAGFVCLLGQRTPPLLGLPGFQRPAIGHNPFAFSAPLGSGQTPFVFDMACSVVARGQILLAAREGRAIPENWALDFQGLPTDKADAALAGILQPSGGFKGMGIAMMIECLAAALGAESDAAKTTSMKLPASGAIGRERAFFLFLNPAIAGDATAFTDYMRHWIDYYIESGASESRIPGQRGGAMQIYCDKEGLSYPATVDTELRMLSASLGIIFPSPISTML